MIIKRAVTIFILFWLICCGHSAYSNPFSCKIKHKESTRKEKRIEELFYKGYAIRDDQRFAVIQYKSIQYALKTGDQLDRYIIISISPRYLGYKLGTKLLRAPIEGDQDLIKNLTVKYK